jgi:hypothetical protein
MSRKSKQQLYDAMVQEFNKALDKEAKAWVKAHVQAFRDIEAEEEAKAENKPPIKKKSPSSTKRRRT